MGPRVTVLMSVYNGLPHLQAAIDSTLAQTLVDFELLIVHDAGTDGSLDLIKSYADPRIRLVLNEHNLGTARTMNRGTELARTQYVARLDQDDVSLPRRLEAQLAFMEARPDLDISCTWEYGLDHSGRRIRNWRTEVANAGEFLGPLALGKCPIWHPSIMFKRQALLDAGGFDPSMSPVEDFDVTMRLALKGYRAAVVPEYLVGQRDHDARQSITKLDIQRRRTREVHEGMIRRFCGQDDPEVLGYLLRMEEQWWQRCTSKADVVALLAALDAMLGRMDRELGLGPVEAKTLRNSVYGRIGRGARLAMAGAGLPAPLFYALLFAGSPWLIPGLRPIAATLNSRIQALRYAFGRPS